ncbi:M15 family metallopeptidase [Flavobacterium sp. J49]|uniref:M15 family metallopeptidase n=1 Tax=Flavobacterium sp. J49 TaxID=2718534 RepID=UPI0015940D4B|nr:M15 family metallopeptidase [Flavobacterium sp. J49]MBF6642391.1 M15 family metallopeptidase [Flavobacterium sp. J49]NIC03637.1 M15 family metallopeptidase [Flavobacterium sp. J49]
MKKISFLLLVFLTLSCKSTYLDTKKSPVLLDINKETDDNAFVNLKNYSNDFVFDMKYATTDNFLNEKVYPCDECFLRVKTVKSLLEANKAFLDKGYKIKLYDCYRPIAIQKQMWKIVPNPTYVANPKKGSIHNKGGAVDITLVDSEGNELNMGTKFDFFGEEASHNYSNHSEEILANRKLLKEIMLQHNFKSFDSEWWHYNLKNSAADKVSNQKWRCED